MVGSRPIRILLVGYGITATGFSQVAHSILGNLPDRYQLHHLVINTDEASTAGQWVTHPNILPGDVHGVVQLEQLIEELQPSIVFILHNVEYYGFYSSILERYKPDIKIVHYCAVDSRTTHPGVIEHLANIDQLVTFTKFGRNVLEEGAALVRSQQSCFKLPPIHVIPLGVDTDLFRPLYGGNDAAGFAASRLAARRLLFPHDSSLQDAFIVLNANQNNTRKRIDITIRGFALFARNKPENVKLYLHMGRHGYGIDVVSYARSNGVEGRLLFSTEGSEHPSVPSEVLNLIYNACDVGINTSSGEGWGLVSSEHAATGAAQIVPKHSACEEVWHDSAMLLEPVSRVVDRDYRENVLVSAEGVAEALKLLYENPDVLKTMSVLAYRNGTKPEYLWKNIVRHWDALFQNMITKD